MSNRMTRQTIHFHQSFILPELADPLPAGSYEVEFEEERMEGLSFTAWRVVRTTLRRIKVGNGLSFAVDVATETLKTAIADNAAVASAAPSAAVLPVPPVPPVPLSVDRSRTWRDLVIPPIVIPAVIGVAVLAAVILGPFQ